MRVDVYIVVCKGITVSNSSTGIGGCYSAAASIVSFALLLELVASL